MKTMIWIMMAAAALAYSRAQEIPSPVGDGLVILPVDKLPKTAPLFFSVDAIVEAKVGRLETIASQRLSIRVHQGQPETLAVGLSGRGEIVSVTGESLRDWSVRTAGDGSRILELRIKPDADLKLLSVDVVTRTKSEDGVSALLLPGPGAATGFTLDLTLTAEKEASLRLLKSTGFSPVAGSVKKRFVATGLASLEISVAEGAAGARGASVIDGALNGSLSADGGSVSFRFKGLVKSAAAGSSAELLSGRAAVSGGVAGDGWHLSIRKQGDDYVHELVAEREGELQVAFDFEAPLAKNGDWRTLEFRIPGGVIVPLKIDGLPSAIAFDHALAVVPLRQGNAWTGFLPASGHAKLSWRSVDAVTDGALFFSSSETSDIRVGNGLVRQSSELDLRVLQGKLPALSIVMDGPGEVLSVTGEPVLGWSVKEMEGRRILQINLSRPIEGSGKIRVETQAALAGFPVKALPLRLLPEGSLRHSGSLRVANEGAVRIEVADANGLIQLAPEQFPGGIDKSLRQVYVYRFPSAEYHYSLRADQILPEVGVTEVTVYEMAETDRRVSSDIELDIREAPLREWEIEIPADYAVASVTGSAVADYVVGTEETAGRKKLKILFQQSVIDRQLMNVRLEKNQAAKAGSWDLPSLGFPTAKSRRGLVGASAAAGYRLVAGASAGLAEVPLTFFPKKVPLLQQAFRLKEGGWKAALTVEALGQSVQADVFHLYSLKSGACYGSVLMNFFVVGAPATEWRIAVPATAANIDISGQNVGRDWRREGDVMIVPLSRPLLGAGTVLLTFEQPMSASGGEISPGEIRPLNVQGERGYLQIVSPLQVNYDVSRSSGALLALDPAELPAEFRLLSSAPVLGVWQYTARDFDLGLKVQWFEPGSTVVQVVDFLKLASRISKDGQWVTDARFFVKSKGRNGLRMKLPKTAMLWEVRVAGKTVNARKDGDQTLVPLPVRSDPNQAIEVTVRYGASAKDPGHPVLSAPVLDAPVVIGEWTATGDEGRVLVPESGNADLTGPVLARTGWQWLGENRLRMSALLAGILTMMILGVKTGWLRILGVVAGLAVGIGSLWMMMAATAMQGEEAISRTIEYAAPMVSAGDEVTIGISNVPAWRANFGPMVWLLLAFAAAIWIGAKALRIGWLKRIAVLPAGCGILSVHGGSPWFFVLILLVVIGWWWPLMRRDRWSLKFKPAAQAAVMSVLFFIVSIGSARAEETPEMPVAESMIQDWKIHDGRLFGQMAVTVRGETGDRFLLLDEPAVLGSFKGDGVRVVKASRGEATAYFLELERSGRATAAVEFEMPLANPAKGWELPGGPAVMRQVTLRWDEGGWEFSSPAAAKISTIQNLAANESGAVLILNPAGPVTIQARPKQRDAGAEVTKFFAEVSNLFSPGPGVVGGRHQVSIRPSQGRVSSLVMKVPAGFTVGDVSDGPIGSWRFDPEKQELRVALEPAQEQGFSLVVESQRGAGALPMELNLEPLRVLGAAGEVGLIGIAFGEEAQPESVVAEGLSRVNPEDFKIGAKVIPSLQHAFRYGAAPALLKVKVSAVAAELRAEWGQLVSLGEDRLLIAADLSVNITRAGVFRLELVVPEGLEIESATGEGLSHWTETGKGGERIVSLHLAGKTMGLQVYSLSLTGAAVGAKTAWQVPRIALRGASRETGILTVVPDRGLQVRSLNRRNVSQVDPRNLAGETLDAAKAAARPGALAYRLLQGDWSLELGISKLDPWVTAQIFHEVTFREGQVLTRLSLNYKIENAALKTLRIRIPGLDAEAAATIRATGPAVADLVPVNGQEGLWEIRLQRGIAGETKVEIEYQRRSDDAANDSVQPILLDAGRANSYFVAVRAGGRLEVEAGELPRGWQAADWAVVRAALGNAGASQAPAMSFRVADAEDPLPVRMKRHGLADLRKLRVSEGQLTSLVSPRGAALTAVDLKMEVREKGTLRLRLPKGAELYNVLVNEEGAGLVREKDEWLFYVAPSPDEGKSASVRFVYSAGSGTGGRLEGPRLNVPMENLSWRVLVPEGWQLSAKGGDFDLKQSARLGLFRLEDYRSFVSSKRDVASQGAVAMLDQANAWLKEGDQARASVALGNAVRSNLLDDASNEDARVQLRQLKTQQAVLGLNSRRQKLVIENSRAETVAGTDQIEKAAELNPVLKGSFNFNPKLFDRFTAGNTMDENAALKDIANRIVSQQLAAEPAPVALDVTLPERGTVMTFSRSVQVDGERPMAIDFRLRKNSAGGWWIGLLACAVVAAAGFKRKAEQGN